MRKYPILMLALALLLGVSAVFAARAMDAPKDQVAFTERVIYGDPAAADGLTVALHEQYRNYLHWASTLSFTESSYTAHTDYTFEHDRYWNNNSGVVRSLNIWDGVSASYDFDQNNALAAAVNALEDKVQPFQLHIADRRAEQQRIQSCQHERDHARTPGRDVLALPCGKCRKRQQDQPDGNRILCLRERAARALRQPRQRE